MKAIIFEKYGQADVLELKEVEKPSPKEDEVLIKVHAASINDWDWGNLRGKPFINRMMLGLVRPKKINILGCDVAGQVEAVGSKTKRFNVGDDVFGDLCESGFGSFAEYVCARENALTIKPASMTFKEAAALPQAGILALRGLQNKGNIKSGQKVLINGAGGGAGSFSIQIAKAMGASVTAVDKGCKLEMMRSIGADEAIDYTKEDFTKRGESYDFILDHMGFHPFFDYWRVLNRGGTCLLVGEGSGLVFKTFVFGPIMSMVGNKKMGILLHKPNRDLDVLIELFESGKVAPVIERCYPLSKTAEAMRHFGAGEVKGKLVITMEG